MNLSYSNEQLIAAARLYYVDNQSQSEIARFIGASQSKVCRMLALAKERGLVQISVPEYDPCNQALSSRIHKAFGIEATVIRTVVGMSPAQLRQTIGYFAAPIAQNWIGSQATVLIAGGRTLQPLAVNMKPPEGVRDVRFAEAMGHIDSTPGAFDAQEICRQLARTWHGTVLTLSAPVLFPDRDSCQNFLKVAQIQKVMSCLAGADIAFVGVGDLTDSVIMERHVFSRKDIAELKEIGAAGELLGRFYDYEGRECVSTWRDRIMSLPLEKLRAIPRRVGVVANAGRAAAILAALRGKLINTLVIDEICAEDLLAHAVKRKK